MVSRLQANYTLHQSVSDSYTIWKMLLRLSEFVRGGRGWRGGGVCLNLTFPFNARMILKYLQSNALTSYIGTGQQWENVTHWIAMQRGFHLFSLLYVLCLIPITVWPHPLLHSFCFLFFFCFSICFFNFMSLICLCSSTLSSWSCRDSVPLQSKLRASSILLPLHPSPPCLLFGCPSISLSLSLSLSFSALQHTLMGSHHPLLLAHFASLVLSPLNPWFSPTPFCLSFPTSASLHPSGRIIWL